MATPNSSPYRGWTCMRTDGQPVAFHAVVWTWRTRGRVAARRGVESWQKRWCLHQGGLDMARGGTSHHRKVGRRAAVEGQVDVAATHGDTATSARAAGANRRRSRAETGARRPGLPAPTAAARTTAPLYPLAYHTSSQGGRSVRAEERWEASEVGRGGVGGRNSENSAATDQDPGNLQDTDGGFAALRSACRKPGPEL